MPKSGFTKPIQSENSDSDSNMVEKPYGRKVHHFTKHLTFLGKLQKAIWISDFLKNLCIFI